MIRSRIRILLKQSKYKRMYIENELGITANTLSNWCTGKTYPTMDMAYKLADILEVDISQLYEKVEKK